MSKFFWILRILAFLTITGMLVVVGQYATTSQNLYISISGIVVTILVNATLIAVLYLGSRWSHEGINRDENGKKDVYTNLWLIKTTHYPNDGGEPYTKFHTSWESVVIAIFILVESRILFVVLSG